MKIRNCVVFTILVFLMLGTFQIANTDAAGGSGGLVTGGLARCAKRVSPLITQVDELRAQLVKAGRTLGSAVVDPLIASLDDAGMTLDKAAGRQISCSQLKPAVDALNQFNSDVTSSQSTIDSQLANGTTQNWINQSTKIINQILKICPCQ
jgi:hypothetical protein